LLGAGALGASACAVAPADPSVDTTEQSTSADEGADPGTAVADPADPFGISDGTGDKASANTSGVYATAGGDDQAKASVHPARPNADSHVDFDDDSNGVAEIHVSPRYADGQACSTGSECESGLCESGVCSEPSN
jgi:hypothetical protein